MVFMPLTGIMMGVFSGKGVPFFGLGTLPGVSKPVGPVAKYSFKTHTYVGKWLEYIVPLHIGAVGYHRLAHSQNILKRMW